MQMCAFAVHSSTLQSGVPPFTSDPTPGALQLHTQSPNDPSEMSGSVHTPCTFIAHTFPAPLSAHVGHCEAHSSVSSSLFVMLTKGRVSTAYFISAVISARVTVTVWSPSSTVSSTPVSKMGCHRFQFVAVNVTAPPGCTSPVSELVGVTVTPATGSLRRRTLSCTIPPASATVRGLRHGTTVTSGPQTSTPAVSSSRLIAGTDAALRSKLESVEVAGPKLMKYDWSSSSMASSTPTATTVIGLFHEVGLKETEVTEVIPSPDETEIGTVTTAVGSEVSSMVKEGLRLRASSVIRGSVAVTFTSATSLSVLVTERSGGSRTLYLGSPDPVGVRSSTVKDTSPSTLLSSTPVTTTRCGVAQLEDVKSSEVGAAVPSNVFSETTAMATSATGCVLRLTSTWSVPPPSPVVSVTLLITYPATSSSELLPITDWGETLEYLGSVLVGVPTVTVKAESPSATLSSTPVMVTVCSVFQVAVVKVRVAGEQVASAVGATVTGTVTAAVGAVARTMATVVFPPASVVVNGVAGTTVTPAVSSSRLVTDTGGIIMLLKAVSVLDVGPRTTSKVMSSSSTGSSTPVTVTVCFTFHVVGWKTSWAVETTPSVTSRDTTAMVTSAPGADESSTVKVAVPPDSEVDSPVGGVTTTDAARGGRGYPPGVLCAGNCTALHYTTL
eukprot:Sspe_Gene.33742::Locus_16450_Transcript_1_1_Confidence_1.000_Length_6022::g.33742::m.33742